MSTFVRGASLGRYRIERLLGSGAMGEVYLAEDPQIGRRVALKTLRIVGIRPEELPERRQRLLREARTAGRLIHPHVVTLFDAGEDGAFIYLAFEYVPGSDLGVRLGAGPPLTLGEALRLARETCAGLDHAHRAGIVHRDIKPSNLLLDAEGRLKISDFGIAKMAGQATELTVTGSVMGSPHYLSPEQIRGEELDGRSDLFSFGVVLYEMLARRRPFGGETLSTLIYQVLQAEPPPLQGLRPDLPPRLAALVGRLLAKDRDERFATAAEVAQELAAVTVELPAAMLAAPAGGTETIEGATRLLESRGAEPPLMPPAAGGPPPPPPPTFSEGPGAGPRGTVAGAAAISPATAPSGPATAPAALGPGGTVVAPPAGLAGGAASPPAGGPYGGAAPVAGSAAPGATTAARAGSARRLAVPIAAGCLLLLALAAGGAYYLAQGPLRSSPLLRAFAERTDRAGAGVEPGAEPGGAEGIDALGDAGGAPGALPLERPEPGRGGDGDEAGASAARRAGAGDGSAGGEDPAAGSGSAEANRSESGAERAGRPGSPPGAEPAAGDAAAQRRASASDSAARPAPPASPPSVRSGSAAAGEVAGDAAGSAPDSAPGSAPSTAPSAAPPTAEPPPLPSPAARRAARIPDTGITSGLGLSFRVLPDDAFVLVDGTVIGRASEWAPGVRHYQLPGPGTYDLTLRKGGMRDRVIRVSAAADGPAVTPVAARLEPLPADEVETGDLEVHRVREAVAFKVEPRVARVLVDGRLVGPASQYSGGIGGRRWLELPRGTYRVSLVAPGHQRVDLAVEFTGGAVEARKRIEVTLPPAPGAN